MAEEVDVRIARLEELIAGMDKALGLQRDEYHRRLDVLNHAHEQIQEILGDTVLASKFEDYVKTEEARREEAQKVEADKRTLALDRVNEKFEDYVTRWEQRQREVDQTITTLTAAAAEAKQIAQEQGRQTRGEADAAAREQKAVAQAIQRAAEEAARKQSRYIAIVGLVVVVVVAAANYLASL